MTLQDFSFRDHAGDFDQHISKSIPGYRDLRDECVSLSRRFVENGTTVIDIGCTTGSLLKEIKDANDDARPGARYLGIDVEPAFENHWRQLGCDRLRYKVGDALASDGYENLSLALSLFTFQFLPERRKLELLRRVFDGLVIGGAMIIAEKILANSALFQEMLTFDYYDFKRRVFTANGILDKERRLRGQMRLWTEEQLVTALCQAGFVRSGLQRFFHRKLFVGYIAVKHRTTPSAANP